MSTNLSKLADELKPYFVPWVRKIAQGGGGGGAGTGGTPDMLAHVLASTSALGTFHTVSGLTAGQVLKATGAASAAFGQLQHSQLGGIGANDHHNQSHSYDSGDHTGTLSWAKINFTGSSLDDLATRNYLQLNSRTHDIVGGDHSYTGGAALDVFGLSAANTLAKLTPSADVSAGVAAILRSTAAGVVGLRKLTSTDTLDFDSAVDRIRVMASNRIGTDNYASQVTGWGIDYLGGADFRYVYTDELHAKSFIADLEQALAGGQIISKSVAVLAEDFALPAASGAATLRVQDLPSAPNMAVFVSGDLIRLRKFSRAAGSLTIADAWGVVTAYADGSGADEGTQTWTFTRSGGGSAGTATGTVSKDAIVLDYGTSGNGYYEVNAIDGAYALNSPYAQTVTWKGHPLSVVAGEGLKVRTRMGNLRGLFGIANEYGFYAGDGSTDADTYIRLSSYTNKINNLPLEWYASGALRMRADSTHGLRLYSAAADEDYSRGVRWYTGSQEFGGVYGWNQVTGSGYVAVTMRSMGASNQGAGANIYAETAGFLSVATTLLSAYAPGGTAAHITLTADNNQGVNRTEQIRFTAEYLWVTVTETDFVGTVDVTGNLSGSSATFSSYVQADGALYANAGRLSASIDAPFYGYSIETPAGTWARGHNFHTTGNATLGGFGAYGSGNTISWYWIGNAYNDFSIRTYPTSGNTEVTGTLAVESTVNAGGAYKRDGVAGGIFVPVSAFYMQDNNAVTWNGSAGRNIGTYVFNPQAAANNSIPAAATAIVVLAGAKWTGSASEGKYILGRGVGMTGGESSISIRHQVANVTTDAFAIIPVGTNGDFQMDVVGENAAIVYVRCIGYFM